MSGLIMAGLSLLTARAGSRLGLFTTGCLRSKAPGLIALRSAAPVVAAVEFFYAVACIPLAVVFLLVGLISLMSLHDQSRRPCTSASQPTATASLLALVVKLVHA